MYFDTEFSKEYEMLYAITDGQAVIVKYEGDAQRVVIPSSLGGYPVTKIGEYAFSEKNMKYVAFPNTLQRIEHHGFSQCTKLVRVHFTESLRFIGNYAFYNCWELSWVYLTASISSIGYGAFKNCEKLTEIVQDKIEGKDISIGSLLDDLNQQIHVVVRHLYEDQSVKEARVIFTEHEYEVVANVASMCKQFEATEIGSGKYIRYCLGSQDIDYNKYDGMFHVMQRGDSTDTLMTVAMERLMYPYGLTQEAAGIYQDFVRAHALWGMEKFIRDEDMEKVMFLADMQVLTSEETDRAIDTSVSLEKTAITAFLMHYKHQHFDVSEDEFEL